MTVQVLLLALLMALAAPAAHTESLIEKSKTLFDLTRCVLKHTQTVCVFKQIRKDLDGDPIPADTGVAGRSSRYVLYTPNNEWYDGLTGKSKDDLLIVHDTGSGMVLAEWHEGKADEYQVIALAPIMALAEKLGIEPEPQEVEIWPFENDGVVYLICYKTDKSTKECMMSAAANMPNGIVHLFSVFENSGTLFDQVTALVLSVDVPPAE